MHKSNVANIDWLVVFQEWKNMRDAYPSLGLTFKKNLWHDNLLFCFSIHLNCRFLVSSFIFSILHYTTWLPSLVDCHGRFHKVKTYLHNKSWILWTLVDIKTFFNNGPTLVMCFDIWNKCARMGFFVLGFPFLSFCEL